MRLFLSISNLTNLKPRSSLCARFCSPHESCWWKFLPCYVYEQTKISGRTCFLRKLQCWRTRSNIVVFLLGKKKPETRTTEFLQYSGLTNLLMPCSPASPLSAWPSPSFYKFLHSFILSRQRVTLSHCSGTSLLGLHLKVSRGSDSKIVSDHWCTSSIYSCNTPMLPRVEVARLLLLEHNRNSIKAITRFDLGPYPVSRDVTSILREHCSPSGAQPAFCTIICAVSIGSLHPSVSDPSSQSGTLCSACEDHDEVHVPDRFWPLLEPSCMTIRQSLAKNL